MQLKMNPKFTSCLFLACSFLSVRAQDSGTYTDCQGVSSVDFCFQIIEESLIWRESVDSCQAREGTLVTPIKKNIIELLNNQYFISSAKPLWIGLSDTEREGSLKWVNGSNLKILPETPYPWTSNSNTEENDCTVMVNDGVKFEWSLVDCSAKYYFVCEIPTKIDDEAAKKVQANKKKNEILMESRQKETFALIESINEQANMMQKMMEVDIPMPPDKEKNPLEIRKEISEIRMFGTDDFENNERRKRNAISLSTYYWPNGIVYYEWNQELPISSYGRNEILKAMEGIEEESCIQFVERKLEEPDYLSIGSNEGCWSFVGRMGGKQEISLPTACWETLGIIQHELLHALGFWHEQSRYDRDDYIDVNWENVKPGYETNFDKYEQDWMNTQNFSYDYNSLLHYEPYAFAIDKTVPTIVPTNPPTAEIGQRAGLSLNDIKEINKLYDCPVAIKGGWSWWSSYSECSSTCGGGLRWRSRACNNPAPSVDPVGETCPGDDLDTQTCMTIACPPNDIDYVWSGCWNDEGMPELLENLEGKSEHLDGNYSSRENPALKCAYAAKESLQDVFALRFGGKCYATSLDGEGELYKSQGPSSECVLGTGAVDAIDVYTLNGLSVNGGWSSWSNYGLCSSSCGGGIKTRTRNCNNPEPSGNGADCEGVAFEEAECNTEECPVDGGWSDWTEWTECYPAEGTCGWGYTFQDRSCDNPKPANGGLPCNGLAYQFETCYEECPTSQAPAINGGWSEWGDYSSCSATCSPAVKTRSRECNNPSPQNGGNDCVGEESDTVTCSELYKCPTGILQQADLFFPMENKKSESEIDGENGQIILHNSKQESLVDGGVKGKALSLGNAIWGDGGEFRGTCLSEPDLCEGITWSFWIQMDVDNQPDTTGNIFLLSTGAQSSEGEGIALYLQPNRMLKFLVRYKDKEYAVDLPPTLVNGAVWHHFSFVAKKSTGLTVFHMGQPFSNDLFGRTSHGIGSDEQSRFTIGRANHIVKAVFDHFGNFLLDELAIWNRPLSANDIYEVFKQVTPNCQLCDQNGVCDEETQACSCPEKLEGDGLVCKLAKQDSLDQISQLGLPQPLTYLSMESGSLPRHSEETMLSVNGIEKNALFFNGRRNGLEALASNVSKCWTNPTECGTSGWTISFWVKIYGRDNSHRLNYLLSSSLYVLENPRVTGFFAAFRENLEIVVQTATQRYQLSCNFPYAKWIHIDILWSTKSGLNLYMDGDLLNLVQSKVANWPAIVSQASSLVIGKPEDQNIYNGEFVIDELLIWEETLSFDQIKQVYSIY